MKIYVYHWSAKELKIPGVYQEGIPDHPKERAPHWIDIPENEVDDVIKELSRKHDVIFKEKERRLYIDDKGKWLK